MTYRDITETAAVSKISAIRALRDGESLRGIGLREAKDIVEYLMGLASFPAYGEGLMRLTSRVNDLERELAEAKEGARNLTHDALVLRARFEAIQVIAGLE